MNNPPVGAGTAPVQALVANAVAATERDEPALAIALLKEALLLEPSSDTLFNELGCLLLQQGELREALPNLQRALLLNPRRADIQYNLGVCYQQSGAFVAAADHYARALALEPGFLAAGFQLAASFAARGELEQAARSYAEIGRAMLDRGRLTEALACLTEAAAVLPSAAAHRNAGLVLLLMERWPEAEQQFRLALAFDPQAPEIHHLLGVAAYRAGKVAAAIECFEAALRLRPIFPEARNDLGNAHSKRGALVEAVANYRYAVAQHPRYAEAWCNLAGDLVLLGREAEAADAYRQAIAHAPQLALAHNGYATLLLRLAQYEAAWREYEWRALAVNQGRYYSDPRDPAQSLPTPSSQLPLILRGKRVLLFADQGLGDELFFLRFARFAAAAGAAVSYLPSPKLAALLQALAGPPITVVRNDQLAQPFDHLFASGDLPLVVGHRAGVSLPGPLRILPPAASRDAARPALGASGPGPYLAVTWRAGLEADGARAKCIAPELLVRAIAGWPGQILSLQRNPQAAEFAAFEEACGREVLDFSRWNTDLLAMAALLCELDEYVGVSNTNMHIAAAVGMPARVLVKFPGEWRWGTAGDTSAWFPDFRLYREQRDCGWDAALRQLRGDLEVRRLPAL